MTGARPAVLLGAALFVALVTSILLYQYLNRVAAATPVTMKAVAVAATNLAWGTKLTAEMLREAQVGADYVPEGAFESREAAVGRILLIHVRTNEAILESKLAPTSQTTGGIAAVTNPRKRAMAVKVDEVVGVAGFVKPGDHVDVMATVRQGPQQQVTKTVLENVLVLASGGDLSRKGKDEDPVQAKVVTLEVTPEEAEKLALATTEGNLRLALRNPLNQDSILTHGATVASLMNSYRIPEPEPPPKPVVKPVPRKESLKIEVIKGGTVKNFIFE
jgi:pilus assembly protein CpaB